MNVNICGFSKSRNDGYSTEFLWTSKVFIVTKVELRGLTNHGLGFTTYEGRIVIELLAVMPVGHGVPPNNQILEVMKGVSFYKQGEIDLNDQFSKIIKECEINNSTYGDLDHFTQYLDFPK